MPSSKYQKRIGYSMSSKAKANWFEVKDDNGTVWVVDESDERLYNYIKRLCDGVGFSGTDTTSWLTVRNWVIMPELLVKEANAILRDAEELEKLCWESGDCDLNRMFWEKMDEYSSTLSKLVDVGYDIRPLLQEIDREIETLSKSTPLDENTSGRLARLLCQKATVERLL